MTGSSSGASGRGPSLDDLVALEEAMWRPETRGDDAWMRERLHPDFREFGRSGRTYAHGDAFGAGGVEFECRLPLPNLVVAELAPGVAQLTYDSVVRYGDDVEHGRRSSIWLHDGERWRMRFHQGTPFVPEGEG